MTRPSEWVQPRAQIKLIHALLEIGATAPSAATPGIAPHPSSTRTVKVAISVAQFQFLGLISQLSQGLEPSGVNLRLYAISRAVHGHLKRESRHVA
jgi:hypothetical protein